MTLAGAEEAIARFVERAIAAVGAADSEYAGRPPVARPMRGTTARCSELKEIDNILNSMPLIQCGHWSGECDRWAMDRDRDQRNN